MSGSHDHDHNPSKWVLSGAWANAWKYFAVIGAIGVAGAGFGFTQDPRRFAFSWMFGFITVLLVALGALFFVLVQRLTSAGWSVTVRRTAEFFALGLIACAVLFLPVLGTMNHLFPWLGGEHGAAAKPEPHKVGQQGSSSSFHLIPAAHAAGQHAAPADSPAAPAAADPHAAPAAPGGQHGADSPDHPAPAHGAAGGAAAHGHAAHGPMGDPHEIIEHKILAKKKPYLNREFFLIRAAFYFAIWIFLAWRLFGYSISQDKSKDPELTLKAQRLAPPATFLFALTLTFAVFDWVMSLEPTWFSTIFGVVMFACGVVSSYAVLILTTLALRSSGPLEGAVTIEHYHDLGKLQFGFLVFWAYVGFSQFMLIWYAALPEETTFFHNRWDYEPWANVSMAIILFHFVAPFFWTISRNFKRNVGRLRIGSMILIVMHVIDIYWFVMPNYHLGKPGFSFHWMDAMCLLACVGVYGAFVFNRMGQHALVPIGDPRLERSLHFQNA